MIKIYLLALMLLLSTCVYANSKVFVLKNGDFVEKSINIETETVNNICSFLGYNKDQFYSYLNSDKIGGDITLVIFKIFTDEIICVITDKSVINLTGERVKEYLSKFNLHKEFDSFDIERTLKNGIANKSLTVEFLGEIFNQVNFIRNGSFVVSQIGYELKFINGFLTDSSPSDGLNIWAKKWKSRGYIYQRYMNHAKKYLGDDEIKILNEINIQADAESRIPFEALEEYVKFHKNNDGIINFKMMLVAHYNENITLNEFKEINYKRYELENPMKVTTL